MYDRNRIQVLACSLLFSCSQDAETGNASTGTSSSSASGSTSPSSSESGDIPPTELCAAEHSSATLVRGQNLTAAGGDAQSTLFSANGAAKLVHQSDGNLVLYRISDGTALWSTNTAGQPSTHAVQQEDGNFVLYNGSVPLWNAGTFGQKGAWLKLQDDCSLVIHTTGGPIWSTNTLCNPPQDPPPDCYARCCDEALINQPSPDPASCVDAAQAVCNDHRHVKRVEWNHSVEAYSRPMGCWALCGNESEYHDLEGVMTGCTGAAESFCSNKGTGASSPATMTQVSGKGMREFKHTTAQNAPVLPVSWRHLLGLEVHGPYSLGPRASPRRRHMRLMAG